MEIISPIPNKVYLGISGGLDSMFALDFLLKGRKDVDLLFFHHGTENSDKAEKFLSSYNVRIGRIGRISRPKRDDESWEEYWRGERYKFFRQFTDRMIITAHNLNDQVENWVMTACHGVPKLIPYKNGNILRPFMMVSRKQIGEYADRHKLSWIEDSSNADTKYVRNRVRHKVLPELLQINPGLLTVVKKQIKDQLCVSSVYIV